jgi:lipopolysaccharide/colanic/teichoic acid biosynthesis glycosyltransferase
MPQNTYENPNSKKLIALINANDQLKDILEKFDFGIYTITNFANGVELFNKWEKENLDISAVVAQGEVMDPFGIAMVQALRAKKFVDVPFVLISTHTTPNLMQLALTTGIADVYKLPLNKAHFQRRVTFLIDNWQALHSKTKQQEFKPYKTPLVKRVFDCFFAGLALVCLSPVFLIVIIALRLESKGPVFYYSPRVGTGYRTFKFYKFRSMYVNADKKLKDLKHLNQYSAAASASETATSVSNLCDECKLQGIQCQFPLYADNNKWCEKQYMFSKKAQAGSAFIKLKNDPRITKVGKIIRNTSIDELPQLWNVIIGDMSIVGNRPLPLYEAEKLTTDKYALRFMAPAGITGLWQVEKRGKGEMSEDERLMLDNTYAKNHSFMNDIRLILKTIPALFQKENV